MAAASYPHIPAGHDPGPLSVNHPPGALARMMRPRLGDVSVLLARTEYRRGESVEPIVNDGGSDRELEIGLVCSERHLDSGRPQEKPTAVTATEWESWLPLASNRPAFAIPSGAPYSHEGTVLSLSWAVAVREPRRGRPDRMLITPIWVSP